MAAKQTAYRVAHPVTGAVEISKGGKTPTFATWAKINGTWEQFGWSYGDQAKAEKTAKTTAGSLGWEYAATEVAAI